MKDEKIRVGIDSYCLASTDLDAMGILEWTKQHGGEGVQFTGGMPVDRGYIKELAGHARSLGLYLEWGGGSHIPYNLQTGELISIEGRIIEAAERAGMAGCRIMRSCSGGLMRWRDDLPATEVLLTGMIKTLKAVLPALQDLGVTMAIETHFEFTTFELLRVFESVGVNPGEGLGVCLDTMNLMTMLEDPLMGTDRVLPWVVATHAKDGCIIPAAEGFKVFTTQVGRGLIPWPALIRRLGRLRPVVTLSIEDHGGEFEIPCFNPVFLSRFPDLTAPELALLQQRAWRGWQMLQDQEAAPVARTDWPALCRERVAAGIKWLKNEVQRGDGKIAALGASG